MATTKKISPKRRKSIAVTNQNKPIPLPSRRRRPHSIVPGGRLSPLTKARRSLAPRKSILKASVNLISEVEDVTESLDFDSTTRDFQKAIHDNTSRKSFGRRVSFAEHAHVRLFAKEKQQNTNSTALSQSSPVQPSSSPQQEVNDENEYPGSATFNRRRSSMGSRNSLGGSDMDMDEDDTAPNLSAFINHAVNEGHSMDDYSNNSANSEDDMQMTTAIPLEVPRTRPLYVAGRQPLSVVPSIDMPSDQSFQQSDTSQNNSQSISFSSIDSDTSHPIEYTVPMGKALRSPSAPSQEWLALRSVTHSGDTPYEAPHSDDDDGENDAMELTDALQRLTAVRRSLGLTDDDEDNSSMDAQGEGVGSNETFSSTEDSYRDMDAGDQTINVTSLLASRVSAGGVSDLDSMTGSWPIGGPSEDVAIKLVPPLAVPQASPSKLGDFHTPPIAPTSQPDAISTPKPPTVPKPFTFTFTPKPTAATVAAPLRTAAGRPPSPVKPRPSAAFVGPVTRPSPKRLAAASQDGEERPSPAKRQTMANKWPAAASTHSSNTPGPSRPLGVKVLSPSKKAPWQSPPNALGKEKPISSLRKHLAQRKSSAIPVEIQSASASPKENSAAGRLSVGSELTSLWALPIPKTAISARAPPSPRLSSPALRVEPGPEHSFNGYQDDDDINVEATEQWREGIQDEGYIAESKPPITISQFFKMTDIRFMDEITAPRRSVHPSSRPAPRDPSTIPLAEYVVAHDIDIPQMELYTHVSKDLQKWIEKTKEDYKEAEEEVQKVTPELFEEFRDADEDGQAELLHQLKLIKANTQGTAKSEWYDWKLQWVQQLYETADEGFNALKSDCVVLEEVNMKVQEILPTLRTEYEQIVHELEREHAEVAEVENCDQDYLKELKTSIAEQNTEVEALKAELLDGESQLRYMQEKLEDLDLQKHEATTAISEARRVMDIEKNSTSVEIFKLKAELEALEALHLWRITKVDPKFFEFIYRDYFRVTMPCIKFKPVMAKLYISKLENVKLKFKDACPQLSNLLLQVAEQQMVTSPRDLSPQEIVQRLSDYWSSCTILRSQLKLVSIKYPLSIEIAQDGTSAFVAKVTVLFVKAKAKAVISFVFDIETFSSWPMSVQSMKCEVEVEYGEINGDLILQAVRSRLDRATPVENHACLLEACIEGMEIYQ